MGYRTAISKKGQDQPLGKIALSPDRSDERDKEFVNPTTILKPSFTLPDVSRFSNWMRFLKTTAGVLRYLTKIRPNLTISINNELTATKFFLAYNKTVIIKKLKNSNVMNLYQLQAV